MIIAVPNVMSHSGHARKQKGRLYPVRKASLLQGRVKRRTIWEGAKAPSKFSNGVYRISYVLFLGILKLFFRIEIKGKENIPSKGPAILVANHSSVLDPPIVTCCTKRIIHWMVAAWVYKTKLLSLIVKRLPFLKVEPGKGNNKEALKKAVDILNKGEMIGIFPEGGLSRNGELNPFLSGTAYIGIKSKAPIIPLYIKGAYQALPLGRNFLKFCKLRVIIGEGFSLNGLYNPSVENGLESGSLYIKNRIEQLKGG